MSYYQALEDVLELLHNAEQNWTESTACQVYTFELRDAIAELRIDRARELKETKK
jgi:hypothetical protein